MIFNNRAKKLPCSFFSRSHLPTPLLCKMAPPSSPMAQHEAPRPGLTRPSRTVKGKCFAAARGQIHTARTIRIALLYFVISRRSQPARSFCLQLHTSHTLSSLSLLSFSPHAHQSSTRRDVVFQLSFLEAGFSPAWNVRLGCCCCCCCCLFKDVIPVYRQSCKCKNIGKSHREQSHTGRNYP